LAILTSMLIILAVILISCTPGAASGDTGVEVIQHSTLNVEDLALQHIYSLTQGLNVAIFPYGIDNEYFYMRPANILDIQLNVYQYTGIEDILLDGTELWRLSFLISTDDLESEYLRWGTFFPDAEGWVGHHTGWNDARTLLVISHVDDNLVLLGNIPWYLEQTQDGLPGAVQAFFEQQR